MATFSEKLKYLIKLKGMTQIEVAQQFGVSHPAVNNWLNGAMPRPSKIKAIADFFNVDVNILTNDSLELESEKLTETYKNNTLELCLKILNILPKNAILDVMNIANSKNETEIVDFLIDVLKSKNN